MGLIFTVGHFVLNDFSLGYFLSLFIASYVYSLLYYYSNSIWLTIAMYSGVHWVGFSFFGTSWKLGLLYNLKIYDVPSWIVDYSNMIIEFAFLLLIVYLNKKRFFDKYFPKSKIIGIKENKAYQCI
jgi:membrane protease YdiL (CAAX protease family)